MKKIFIIIITCFNYTIIGQTPLSQSVIIEGEIYHNYYYLLSAADNMSYDPISLVEKQEQLKIYDKAFKYFNGFNDHLDNALSIAVELKDKIHIKKYIANMFYNGSTWEECMTNEIKMILGNKEINLMLNEYKTIRSSYLKRIVNDNYIQLIRLQEKDQIPRVILDEDSVLINDKIFIKYFDQNDSINFYKILSLIKDNGFFHGCDAIIIHGIRKNFSNFETLKIYLDRALLGMKISNYNYSTLIDKIYFDKGIDQKYGVFLMPQEVEKLSQKAINILNKNRLEIYLPDIKKINGL